MKRECQMGGSQDVGAFVREMAGRPPHPAREVYDFLRSNKKWWLTPIIAVLGLFGLLIALSSTAAAPFIYTIF